MAPAPDHQRQDDRGLRPPLEQEMARKTAQAQTNHGDAGHLSEADPTDQTSSKEPVAFHSFRAMHWWPPWCQGAHCPPNGWETQCELAVLNSHTSP